MALVKHTLKWNDETVFGILKEKQIAGLEAIGEAVIQYIKTHFSGYYPPASSPGKPPAIRTKRLHDSITYYGSWQRKPRSPGEGEPHEANDAVDKPAAPRHVYKINIGTNVPYAEDLEIGITVAPRPFMVPAIQTMRPQMEGIFREAAAKIRWRRGSGVSRRLPY